MLRRNKFIKNQDGGVLIFMALAIALLVVAVGLAIDAGRIFLVNSKAQTALDAAVISAAAVSYAPVAGDAADEANLKALIEQRGDDFFAANYPSGYMGVSVSGSDVTFVPTDPNGTQVRGDLNINVPTFFGDFAMTFVGGSGLDNVNMDEFAEVQRVIPDIDFEIALALDYTTSMCPSNSCATKFTYMRESVGLLINSLESSLQATSGNTEIHYSFIPFTHTVKVDNDIDNLRRSQLGDRAYNATFSTLPNVRGLTENTTQITNDLASIQPDTSGQAVSGTNVGVGAYWGWSSLRNNSDSTSLFTGASRHTKTPVRINDDSTYKMLLLLTDGKNEKATLSPRRTPPWRSSDDPSADIAQEAACAGAKREGIELRTIAFAVDSADARNRLRDCASTRDGVTFYYEIEDADDAQGLRDVFRQIANDLIDLRLRK